MKIKAEIITIVPNSNYCDFLTKEDILNKFNFVVYGIKAERLKGLCPHLTKVQNKPHYCRLFLQDDLVCINGRFHKNWKCIQKGKGFLDDWVSMKDKLPKLGNDVLIFVTINDGFVYLGEYKGDGFSVDDGYDYFDLKDVSHWMLLPEKPVITEYKRNDEFGKS